MQPLEFSRSAKSGAMRGDNAKLAFARGTVYGCGMTITVEAIYEDGKLVLPAPVPLPDKAHVMITIETKGLDSDDERQAWLKLSEQTLMKVWDNPGDDIFDELLAK